MMGCDQQASSQKHFVRPNFKAVTTLHNAHSAKLLEVSFIINFQSKRILIRIAAKKGFFDYLYNDDHERGQRFGLGMAGTEIIKALTEDVFSFETLPKNAKIVDIGGGRGQVSIRIAEKMPAMTFVVQDEELILQAGIDGGIPDEVVGRVEFTSHNFFQPQPVKGADVYLLRFILHDHPDRYGFVILNQYIYFGARS